MAERASEPFEPLWTVKQVAAFLSCSESWVYGQCEAAKMPHLKMGGLLRFEPETVRAWIRGEKVELERKAVVTPLRR